LHEVKKGGKKQETVDMDRGVNMEDKVVDLAELKAKSKARDLQGRCVDADDDFFASRPERPPMSTCLLNTQGPGTSSKTNRDALSKCHFFDHDVGSGSSHIGLVTPSRVTLMKLTTHDESDPWVDTDSVSVDDSGEEIFDIFSSSPTVKSLRASDTSTDGVGS